MNEALGLSDFAKTEDNPIVERPAKARTGATAVEPTLAIAVTLDVEHVRAAAGSGDALHRHPDVFAFRLVFVLAPQLWAVFGSAELDDLAAEVLRAPLRAELCGHEFIRTRIGREAKILQTDRDQIDGLFPFRQHECRLRHDVLRQGARFVFDACDQFVVRHSADFDGFPNSKISFTGH